MRLEPRSLMLFHLCSSAQHCALQSHPSAGTHPPTHTTHPHAHPTPAKSIASDTHTPSQCTSCASTRQASKEIKGDRCLHVQSAACPACIDIEASPGALVQQSPNKQLTAVIVNRLVIAGRHKEHTLHKMHGASGALEAGAQTWLNVQAGVPPSQGLHPH